jgi:hypothetical protein
MVKKSRPQGKVQSKVPAKKEAVVSGQEETKAPGEEESTASGDEKTLVSRDYGGKIDTVLVMMGAGILFGILFIILGVLRYGLHVL